MTSLEPARYEEPDKKNRFRPKLPWAIALLFAAGVVGGVYMHLDRQVRQVDAARAEIHRAFREQVEPVAPELRAFRERIERWVMEASAVRDGESWAKPGSSLDDLHELRGLYLRIHEGDTHDAAKIRQSALSMNPDAIGRCLGIAPVALRGFYERSLFLEDGMLDEVATSEDLMRMRVIGEQVSGTLRRNVPLLVDMARSDYFLLAIQRGGTRHQDPVDFYLWDLRPEGGELLLRTRAKASGSLLTVRNAMPDAPRTEATLSPRTTGAQDCSLAAQVRATANRAAELPAAPTAAPAAPTPAP